MLDTIIGKLKEPSTLRGLSLILGLVGVKVSPELTDTITTVVVAVLALIEVIRKEKPTVK